MVMDRINGFSNLSPELLNRVKGTGPVDSRSGETAVSRSSRSHHRGAPADKADISPKAHRLIALRNALEQGLRALEGVPEVRQDRVAEARARLDRGFYNSVEVRSLVAERLDNVARKMEDI